ncbi:transcriptional regulator [Kutzneria sp. NPDC052558]|uniref:transcriptional regulator n=1 Tax=Kutzneria sp. NPDC052558 TaxID=3364121 RepID=UPI0037C64D2A
MTEPAFDELIHPPHRLKMCAILATAQSWEFSTIRDMLDVSDSVLSKQVKVLQDAGYVTVTKAPHNSRTRTWLALTETGRAALAAHLAELRRITDLASVADFPSAN